MAPGLGVRAVLNFSVFSAVGEGLVLAECERFTFSVDDLLLRRPPEHISFSKLRKLEVVLMRTLALQGRISDRPRTSVGKSGARTPYLKYESLRAFITAFKASKESNLVLECVIPIGAG